MQTLLNLVIRSEAAKTSVATRPRPVAVSASGRRLRPECAHSGHRALILAFSGTGHRRRATDACWHRDYQDAIQPNGECTEAQVRLSRFVAATQPLKDSIGIGSRPRRSGQYQAAVREVALRHEVRWVRAERAELNPRTPAVTERTYPLGTVLSACPDIVVYAKGGIANWRRDFFSGRYSAL
jgi:hypothetical protein